MCGSDEEMAVRVCAVLASGIAKKWMPMPTSNMPKQSASRARSGHRSAKSRGESCHACTCMWWSHNSIVLPHFII